jgi:pilus assembly protein TadC
MLLITAIATIGAAAFFFAELATAPMRTRRNLVHRAANYGRIRTITGREMPRFRERAFAPFVTKMARLMLRVNPRSTTEAAAARLMAAGMRKTSPTGFIASKGILALGLAFFGLLLGTATAPKYALPLLFLFGVLGFAAPGIYVNSRAKRRQAAVAAELPDARVHHNRGGF